MKRLAVAAVAVLLSAGVAFAKDKVRLVDSQAPFSLATTPRGTLSVTCNGKITSSSGEDVLGVNLHRFTQFIHWRRG